MPPAQPSPRPGPLDLAFGARGELTAAVLAGSFLLAWWVLDRALHVPGAGPLVWISLGIGMVYGLRAAVGSLARLSFDIDALMVVAAALAAYWGAPGEAALLLFLFVLAGSLEGFALSRTTRAIEALHKLMPDDTLVWRPAPEAPPATGSDRAQGRWVRVPPDELSVGDLLMLPPGETIPADCRLAEGDSAVNQATLTGESLPRVVGPGDELYAGTINVGNPITAQVLRPARDSSLRRILALVLEAQQQREPVQRLIDRLGQPYALGVVGVSVAVLLVWWLVLAEPLIGPRGGALYTAITLLIVLSPCAIIIATPTATLAAITRAAREGVLFKGGQAIDRLASLRALALDKTGTLTIGRPRLVDVEAAPSAEQPALLAIAAGLEAESTHPIAAALREAAALRGIEPEPATSRTSFRAGRGVSGLFRGREARLGTFEHARQLVPPERRDHVRDVMERAQARGDLAVCLATGDRACVFVLTDQVRPGARELVPRLHELNIAPVVMLTGDNAVTARRVADELGLDRWQAQLLPQDKVRALAELRREIADARAAGPRPRLEITRPRRGVGIIGDGVNDAPALSAADVSAAIGSIGSDAALESADIVLLGDDLAAFPWAVRLARRARRTVAVNLAFGLAAITVMAVITLVGSRVGFTLPLWAGVLGHEGGTLLVVANSLLLLGFRGPERRAPADLSPPPPPKSDPASRLSAPAGEPVTVC